MNPKSWNLKFFFFLFFTPVIFNQLTLSQNSPQHSVSTFSVEIQILAISCPDDGKHAFFSRFVNCSLAAIFPIHILFLSQLP